MGSEKLLILRGLPGSGKSTEAARLVASGAYDLVCEADQFFETKDGYRFDPAKLKDAHADCFARTRSALEAGKRVIVANTFTRAWEFRAYLDYARTYGIPVEVRVLKGEFKSVHRVPAEALAAMAKRWED